MRVRKPGKITDNLWLLGTEASSVYLLEGKNESMLINGGLSCLVPDLLDQFQSFGIDDLRISKILLLHSHFDHIGIAPFFKRRNADLEICASTRASTVLRNPKVIRAVNEASQFALKSCKRAEACANLDLNWQTGIDFLEVNEGGRIDLGELEIEIYETPGHSPCSISAYLPDLNVLFPSDAGGLPLRDKIVTYGTSDYTAYEKSLERLMSLKTRFICSDHYGYVCGDEATDFIKACLDAAKKRRALIAATYKQVGDIEKTAEQIADRYKDEGDYGMVPYDVFVAAQRSMIIHIADAEGLS